MLSAIPRAISNACRSFAHTAQAMTAWALCLGAGLVLGLGAQAGESLVPATSTLVKDSTGMRWDLQTDGSVLDGNNDCFDNGMQLRVNGTQFQPSSQAMVTADQRKEFVFSGSVGTVTVVRRVGLEIGRPIMRWSEVITNTTAQQVTVSLSVQSQLGSNANTTQWSDATPCSGGQLPKGTCGVAMIQQARGSRPSIVWWVGEPGTKAAPQIQVQNHREITATWTVTIPPKSTRVVMHWLQQSTGITGSSAKNFEALYKKGKLLKHGGLPELAKNMVNFKVSDETAAAFSLPQTDAIAEALGIERGAQTIVAVSRQDAARMSGNVAGGTLTAVVRGAPMVCERAQLSAIVNGDGGLFIHFRDGDVLSASSIGGDLRIESSDGLSIPVDPMRVLAVILPKGKDDGRPAPTASGYVTLVTGDRLAVSATGVQIAFATAWGAMQIPLNRVAVIYRVNEPVPAWRVVLDDGSRFLAQPGNDRWDLTSARLGAVIVDPATVVEWRANRVPEALDSENMTASHVIIGNEQVLLGEPKGFIELEGDSGATRIDLSRAERITLPKAGDTASVAMVGGMTLSGRLTGQPLTLTNHDLTWTLPPDRIGGLVVVRAATKAATAPSPASATQAAMPAPSEKPVPDPSVEVGAEVPAVELTVP